MSSALRYARLLAQVPVRETPLLHVARELTELELQAHWFAGDFGLKFTGTAGEAVEVVQLGVWNHESGPDFTDAAVRVNDGPVRRGCIELDPDAADWERHGHATNAAFDNVVLHVFARSGSREFFTRTSQNRAVPQVLIDRAAVEHIAAPASLPLAKAGRCVAPLRNVSPERTRDILEAAAQFRLQRKAAQLVKLAELHGHDEALYQALATTLGYKENKLPFTLIAQRLPLRALQADKPAVDALLLGVGGFLAAADLSKFSGDTRVYVRGLWETWWRKRPDFERLVLPASAWHLGGLRPVNHPQRRLAALAQIVKHWSRVRALTDRCDPAGIVEFFVGLDDDYWSRHYTLRSRKSASPLALIGETRVIDMLANVFFPLARAWEPEQWPVFTKLRARLTNRRIETAALRLFGADGAHRQFVRTVCHQQGLLQIYEDFCMQDESDCARCPFPERVIAWK